MTGPLPADPGTHTGDERARDREEYKRANIEHRSISQLLKFTFLRPTVNVMNQITVFKVTLDSSYFSRQVVHRNSIPCEKAITGKKETLTRARAETAHRLRHSVSVRLVLLHVRPVCVRAVTSVWPEFEGLCDNAFDDSITMHFSCKNTQDTQPVCGSICSGSQQRNSFQRLAN
ncbi:hypothetical protein F2P81_010352 [Scophthalmus maximus]|uniref:Uncharacterized protein n=1 Tax=Scophthalmus maximus TaxID=52904 RepID=A0A6A4SZL3_SCOMX|nr:hypothetical protein F2P81_010352 [Scophthalmus maximus]